MSVLHTIHCADLLNYPNNLHSMSFFAEERFFNHVNNTIKNLKTMTTLPHTLLSMVIINMQVSYTRDVPYTIYTTDHWTSELTIFSHYAIIKTLRHSHTIYFKTHAHTHTHKWALNHLQSGM